jgi:4-amino-4-deoxy-L-arabinose transferase-like glycosyltransferase
VTAAVFSFMTGVIHPYYTNMLAPAIAVLVGVGATLLWQRRDGRGTRLILAAMLGSTAVWSFLLLERVPSWHPWLRMVVLIGGLTTAVAIAALGSGMRRRGVAVLATAGLAFGLAAPAAYTLSTVATAQSGQNVSAGPAVAGAAGGRGMGAGGFPGRNAAGAGGAGAQSGVGRALVSLVSSGSSRYKWVAATSDWQTAASIELASGKAVMAIGGFSSVDGMTLTRFEALVAAGKIHYFVSGGGTQGAGGMPPFGRGDGPPSAGSGFPGGYGFPGSSRPSGASGGFGARGGPQGAGRQVASQIQSWVAAHYKSHTVGGTTVYDLTQPKAGA